MKFIPKPGSLETPFCSLSIRGKHGLGRSYSPVCDECGSNGLTDSTSDHMAHTSGLATLCLSCAEAYKEIWRTSVAMDKLEEIVP